MREQQSSDFIRLGRFLDRCAEFDEAVGRLLAEGENLGSRRHIVTTAYCRAAFGHAVSQRLLMATEQHGTALALIRLHFETTVRAAWVLLGAKDDWLEKFTAPIPEGVLTEPVMGPPVPAMLDAVEAVAADLAREGRRAFRTVNVMHSFVHGGVHLVAHALRGYPPANLIDILRNRNLLLLMLGNVIVVGSNNQTLHGSVGRLSRAYADLMPPVATTPEGEAA